MMHNQDPDDRTENARGNERTNGLPVGGSLLKMSVVPKKGDRDDDEQRGRPALGQEEVPKKKIEARNKQDTPTNPKEGGDPSNEDPQERENDKYGEAGLLVEEEPNPISRGSDPAKVFCRSHQEEESKGSPQQNRWDLVGKPDDLARGKDGKRRDQERGHQGGPIGDLPID